MHKLTLRHCRCPDRRRWRRALSIVYVFPHLTDIGQLALVIAAVSAASAWVATSSELLSYARHADGIRVLPRCAARPTAPTTEVTVLRDRMVGILLGNVLMSISFSVLWPTSAFDRARSAMAQALRTLGDLTRDVDSALVDADAAHDTPSRALVRARGASCPIAVFESEPVASGPASRAYR